MRKVIAIAVVMALFMGGCAIFKTVVDIAVEVLKFIQACDKQVIDWHKAGWLPDKLYDEYCDLKAKAEIYWETGKAEYEKYKDEFLEWIEKFLSGTLEVDAKEVAPSADGPRKPFAGDIIATAEMAAAEGYITESELAALEAAAK